MPVYHCGDYLWPAIQSILHQTFQDFELLIITNQPPDPQDLANIKKIDDPRLKHFQHQEGMGIVPSLLFGIKKSSGRYLARMDGDDLSLPERLAQQVSFLDDHADIGLVGSQAQIINEEGILSGALSLPLEHELIAWTMAFKNPLAHPSLMIRREILGKETYNQDHLSEDYWLWSRLIFKTKIVNLPSALIQYRFYPQSTTTRLATETQQSSADIRKEYLKKFISIGDRDFAIWDQAGHGHAASLTDLYASLKIFKKFLTAFLEKFNPPIMTKKRIISDYRQKIKNMIRWFLKNRWRQLKKKLSPVGE